MEPLQVNRLPFSPTGLRASPIICSGQSSLIPRLHALARARARPGLGVACRLRVSASARARTGSPARSAAVGPSGAGAAVSAADRQAGWAGGSLCPQQRRPAGFVRSLSAPLPPPGARGEDGHEAPGAAAGRRGAAAARQLAGRRRCAGSGRRAAAPPDERASSRCSRAGAGRAFSAPGALRH